MKKAKLDLLTVGQIIYDYHKYKSHGYIKEGCWRVLIKEIDIVNRKILIGWNGNSPEWVSESFINKMYTEKKEPKRIKSSKIDIIGIIAEQQEQEY